MVVVHASMPPGKRTIAIVEDDASFRRATATERLLGVAGFEAQTFTSAEELFSSAAPESHACLILDIHLPGISGFELRDHLTASVPPAIFITAEDEESVRQRASLILNSVYLQKPFAGTALLVAVRSLLNRGGSSEEASGLAWAQTIR